jgi:hypothetical protein
MREHGELAEDFLVCFQRHHHEPVDRDDHEADVDPEQDAAFELGHARASLAARISPGRALARKPARHHAKQPHVDRSAAIDGVPAPRSVALGSLG